MPVTTTHPYLFTHHMETAELITETDPAPISEPYGLFPFQDRTVEHLRDVRRCVVVAHGGFDRIAVTLALSAEALSDPTSEVQRVVILTTSALVDAWDEVIQKVTDHEDILLANRATTTGQRWRNYAGVPARWIVVPYTLLGADAAALLPMMANTMVIIDQAHLVQNPNAQRSVATQQLSVAANTTLMLMAPYFHYEREDWARLLGLALDPTQAHTRQVERISRAARVNVYDGSLLSIC